MSGPNNVNNDYVRPFTNVCQSSDPGDFNFNTANPPIHQYHTQNFPPPVTFSLSDNADVMSMNTMNTIDYRNTGDYMSDYASYQGNPSDSYYTHSGNIDMMNGQLNIPNHDQAETHANSSCPLPVPFQTVCDTYSDTMNDGPTDNFQRLGINMTNNSSISYILTHEPTNSGYVFMKVEYTQLGRISAADIDKILALTQM
ncbi:4309_t:CDS:1 [Paraglomus brasilianum]|uniref:4309_t:CDS:1 n=1 Tax=Paraglomus brasilianum TaxID=144538 RepID=A0A9N9CB36_9GLOM|nr:4309_t:CDS:1 [Paraglomus brasilianum]